MVAVRKKLTFIFSCLYQNRSSMPFKNALSIFYKIQISCLCLKNCGPSSSSLKEILRCLSYLYKKKFENKYCLFKNMKPCYRRIFTFWWGLSSYKILNLFDSPFLIDFFLFYILSFIVVKVYHGQLLQRVLQKKLFWTR
jgi:hypothetical protein